MTSLSCLLSGTLTPLSADPWIKAFATLPEDVLLDLLAHNQIPMGGSAHADRPASLLAAFLSRFPLPGSVMRVKPRESLVAIPQGSSSWRQPDPSDAPNVLAAHLVLRLWSASADASSSVESILEVALGHGWTDVVVALLPRLPAARGEQWCERVSPLKLPSESHALPWLHALAFAGRKEEMAAWFRVPGANPNLKDRLGRTPLFLARDPDVVDVLLAAGADPSLVARDGRTAQATWLNPTGGLCRLDPAQQQSVSARLQQHEKEAGIPGRSTRIETLNVWLRDDPPAWNDIPHDFREALSSERVEVSLGGSTVSWGVVGYLALNLPYFYFDRRLGARDKTPSWSCPRLARWHALLNSLPQTWLDHESVEGVPDGWVMAAALRSRLETGVTNAEEKQAMKAVVGDLESRLAFGHSEKVQSLERWVGGTLGPSARSAIEIAAALAAILPKTKLGEKRRWLAAVSSWALPAYRSSQEQSLRDVAAVTAVLASNRWTRGVLLENLSFLEQGRDCALKGAAPADAWHGLIQVFSELLSDELNRREYRPQKVKDAVRAGEEVFARWLKAGLPPDLRVHLFRRSLDHLKSDFPLVVAAFEPLMLSRQLEKATPDKPRAARRRM